MDPSPLGPPWLEVDVFAGVVLVWPGSVVANPALLGLDLIGYCHPMSIAICLLGGVHCSVHARGGAQPLPKVLAGLRLPVVPGVVAP